MKRTERERLEHPRPRNVDGFAHAASRGLLPSVPSFPPSPTSGVLSPSAHHTFIVGLARVLVATGIYALLVFGALPRVGLPSGVVVAILLVSGAAWFILILRAFDRPGRRMLDEIVHGYTTFDTSWPNYFGSKHSWGEAGPPWDNSGVWILDRNLTVRSVPNRQVDPPGFYPSPHRAGQWELWTGVVWSGTYRDDPWPRLRLPVANVDRP